MVEIDGNTLGLILGLFIPLGIAIAFIVRLEMRVKHLENEIEQNPILNALKQFEQSYIVKMLNDFITKRSESRDG